jgi:hypothetical protein
MSKTRVRKPKVSPAGVALLAQLLRDTGAKIATAKVLPDGSYEVVTIDGAYLTAPKPEAQDSWGHLKLAKR